MVISHLVPGGGCEVVGWCEMGFPLFIAKNPSQSFSNQQTLMTWQMLPSNPLNLGAPTVIPASQWRLANEVIVQGEGSTSYKM